MSGLSANISRFNSQAQTYGDISKFGFGVAKNAIAIGEAASDIFDSFKKPEDL